MTRDELEAAIWRRWPTRDPIAVEAVDAILTLIDTHVRHVAGITAERRATLDSAQSRKRGRRVADTREDPPVIHGWGPGDPDGGNAS